ncbi:DUF2235 domain-containing protein [Granulicella tundricola]|uniref:T6SS Phospholipase effector Tle1-like catalytic domain-containing protein n=1 Tax=Granulicella tundricola (strain ATCC BAA-1859 / DSM 23138 / MP5ACTX9) TaxID=1198114 RepID=E8WY10_GRATM|nr:DUF2235 domain-containing protein [Granulicella tundricola]ADW67549.1 Protein of unknown function DUF2235 [Granulicella tundricola MP5ACTX9]
MKSIVLCADGTWNTPHGDTSTVTDTNVRKLYCALTNDPTQLKYYDSGVGTDGTPLDHLAGGAMGQGLFQKVQDCYAFLGNVYDPGDRIYLFGFSRGAYTARSLAGMIAAFGVPSINLDNSTVPRIFAAYREPDATKKAALKAALVTAYGLEEVKIQMVGVWDTVGSLGIPGIFFNMFNQKQFGFLDTKLHPSTTQAYHAVSIDERRAQFQPTLWTNADGSYRPNDANLEQVFFPGVHCDVGGSYEDSRLSDIPLSWMMQKAKENGLIFSAEAEKTYLTPGAANATGDPHDEWKILPWGLPEHRTIPPNATISNSVQMRLDGIKDYRPENVTLKDGKLSGYSVAAVLPYTKPGWA